VITKQKAQACHSEEGSGAQATDHDEESVFGGGEGRYCQLLLPTATGGAGGEFDKGLVISRSFSLTQNGRFVIMEVPKGKIF
jgi:hypothetical protein